MSAQKSMDEIDPRIRLSLKWKDVSCPISLNKLWRRITLEEEGQVVVDMVAYMYSIVSASGGIGSTTVIELQTAVCFRCGLVISGETRANE